MTTRIIGAILACSVISHAEVPSRTVTGAYHFTTPQTIQGLEEAAKIVKTVAPAPLVSIDDATATLTFSGPAESVDFAAWLLPQVDKTVGDNAVHQYSLPSGDIGRVFFVPGVVTPQAAQELLTVFRVVPDVQKLFFFTANRALVMRAPEWQVAFSAWIIDRLNQPTPQQPDPTRLEFTVGGPDYRVWAMGRACISSPASHRLSKLSSF